jgi:hypothetical protein
MSSRAAVHLGLSHQAVSRASSPCIASDEFQTSVNSCRNHVAQLKCTDSKCTKSIVPCGLPNCCMEGTFSGSSYVLATCSNSCCLGVDEKGNRVTVNSCLASSSVSGPTSSSPSAGSPAPPSAKAGSKSSNCFPAHATVEHESGARIRMDELRVGHRVKVAKDTYSDVFLFTHKLGRVTAPFVVIRTASGHEVSMTSGHYVYINDASLVPVSSVQIGDELALASGARSAVVAVSEAVHGGLYNPQTLHGDIFVDGIVASTYTTAVAPVLGHASLSPLRALYSALGLTISLFNGGADYAARLLPSGVLSY